MIPAETGERDLVEAVLERYRADGFSVLVNPSRSALPPLLANHHPDAIALRSDKKILIEFVRSGRKAADWLNSIRKRLAQDNWELVVHYISPGTGMEKLETAPPEVIGRTAKEVVALRDAGQLNAALLVGWAALEAIARALLPDRLARPQPPAALLGVLAGEGFLTPREADALRDIAAARNAAAHGRLEAAVRPEDLDALLAALSTLTELLPRSAA